VSTALDVADLVDHHYNLEVSSPGLERPLSKAEHYHRFAGLKAKVRLEQALDAYPGRKAFRGEILGERDGAVLLREDDLGSIELPLARIARASLVYEPAPKVKPGKQKQNKQKQKGAAPGAAATHDEDKPQNSRGASEQER
jgi:ribosome maturation factor RimP